MRPAHLYTGAKYRYSNHKSHAFGHKQPRGQTRWARGSVHLPLGHMSLVSTVGDLQVDRASPPVRHSKGSCRNQSGARGGGLVALRQAGPMFNQTCAVSCEMDGWAVGKRVVALETGGCGTPADREHCYRLPEASPKLAGHDSLVLT